MMDFVLEAWVSSNIERAQGRMDAGRRTNPGSRAKN